MGGFSEDVNMDKIRTYMEMDSHEEKLANIIKETQLENAKRAAQERAKEIQARRTDHGGMEGIGNGSGPVGMSDMHSYPGIGGPSSNTGTPYQTEPLGGDYPDGDDDVV